MKKVSATRSTTQSSVRIQQRIDDLGDWRGRTLSRVRALMKQAVPDVVEEWKWVKPTSPGVPVWSQQGMICTGEVYKDKVKLTFAKGAALKDAAGLFNASLDGGTRRAIDLREGETIDRAAFLALVRQAAAFNDAGKAKQRKPAGSRTASTRRSDKTEQAVAGAAKPVKLLSGGNPRIAKAEGDAPVQAYVEALSGWKRDLARRLDALIVRAVPEVRKAVKWNSPFYGVEGRGYFVSFHAFARYIKVTFFKGTSLRPAPTGGTSKEARWIDLHEDDLDEAQLTRWVKQAAAIPGWAP